MSHADLTQAEGEMASSSLSPSSASGDSSDETDFLRPPMDSRRRWPRKLLLQGSERLEARHLKRRGYRYLWRRRHNTDTDVEVALEWKFMLLIGSMVKALLLLLYSIIQVVASQVPAAISHGNCSFGTDWMPVGAIQFISSPDLSFAASFVEEAPNVTRSAIQMGYRTDDGRFGVCQVPARVVATLHHSTEVHALAWGVSTIGIMMCASAYLFYSRSDSLLVLFQQLRLKQELPVLTPIKGHDIASQPFVRLCYFIMGCLTIGLALCVLVPTIPYSSTECPMPAHYDAVDQLHCSYSFPASSTQWSVYLACLLALYSIWCLIGSFSNILHLLADPLSGIVGPSFDILLNDARRKEFNERRDKQDDRLHPPARRMMRSSPDRTCRPDDCSRCIACRDDQRDANQ